MYPGNGSGSFAIQKVKNGYIVSSGSETWVFDDLSSAVEFIGKCLSLE